MSSVDFLLALLITVPILTATLPLVLGLRFERVGWTVAAVVCTVLFLMAIALANVVLRGSRTVIHELGGFPGPIGIELVADAFSMIIVLLVTGTAMSVLAYTRSGGPRGNTFYAGYLLLTGGLLGLTLTGDVFNMFVFLEITGLATYALIAKGDGGEAAIAALKYLIIGTVGASLYLIGVGFLFISTGTLNMADLSTSLPAAGYDDPLVRAAFVFVFVGFAIKVAQWPVHTWQPDAYQRAPDGVTPLIAALVSTVSAYALGRVLFFVFTVDFLIASPSASTLIVVVGSVSVLAGSILAVIQADVKRMLAYSSVSQFGLIVAAYGLVSETALLGAVVHLVGHGIMKASLFLAVGVITLGYGARTVDEYAGLAKRRPYVAGAMAALGLALVGVPPSIGFIGKWYIAVGAVETESWGVAGIIFLSTMLTLAYVARLLEKMYFDHSEDVPSARHVSPGVATDGGYETDARAIAGGVSIGMVGVAVVGAIIAILLGFTGVEFETLFEGIISEVFD